MPVKYDARHQLSDYFGSVFVAVSAEAGWSALYANMSDRSIGTTQMVEDAHHNEIHCCRAELTGNEDFAFANRHWGSVTSRRRERCTRRIRATQPS